MPLSFSDKELTRIAESLRGDPMLEQVSRLAGFGRFGVGVAINVLLPGGFILVGITAQEVEFARRMDEAIQKGSLWIKSGAARENAPEEGIEHEPTDETPSEPRQEAEPAKPEEVESNLPLVERVKRILRDVSFEAALRAREERARTARREADEKGGEPELDDPVVERGFISSQLPSPMLTLSDASIIWPPEREADLGTIRLQRSQIVAWWPMAPYEEEEKEDGEGEGEG